MSPDCVVSPLVDQYLPLLVKKRISSTNAPLRTQACVTHSSLARVNAGLLAPLALPRHCGVVEPYVNLIPSIQLPERTSTCVGTRQPVKMRMVSRDLEDTMRNSANFAC